MTRERKSGLCGVKGEQEKRRASQGSANQLAVLSCLQVDDWQFDAFKLSEVTDGRPLSLLSFALLKRCEIVDK